MFLRFGSGGANLRAAVGKFVEIADHRIGLIACAPDGEIIAHAECVLLDSGTAEVTLVVADRLHGYGLGRAMIDVLITDAQTRGIHRLAASVLPENVRMQAFAHALGATVNKTPDEYEVSLAIAPAASERAAA